ncbi:MAG: glycosyltransferase family 4 protein [Bacteroidales bacterium]|nr:glycosyltransferase family 4 protein [Bacteroidales bacterium]
MEKKRDNIYFWFDSPPKVGKGAFNYVANNWSEEVFFVFNNDFREERKASNWNDGDFGKAKIIALYEESDPNHTIENIFLKDKSSIHIVNGLATNIMNRIEKFLLNNDSRLIVFTERPDQMGGIVERYMREIFFHIKYRQLNHKFNKIIKAFLPLGGLGKKVFMKYGWSEKKIFPFMYNPQMTNISALNNRTTKDEVRFLYVGRFYFKTKGVDTLMKATSYLKGNWHLDLVGGYGKNAEEVKAWAQATPTVDYIGRWNSLEVTKNMQDYDVIVVPTKYDGWNLLINEGLHAGVGVITTDEAVSHEVIEESGAGMVVRANKPKELAEAMQRVIDNPEMANKWRSLSRNFVENISTPTVGKYLIDIILFAIYNEGIRPKCPWIKNE